MRLLQILKRNKDARKIFGERELKIIEKQLWGMQLTQSEKNRLSRDIRKKFAFIKEASNFSEEFALKKGAEIKILIDSAVNSILNHQWCKKIKRIILFGSTVKNQRSLRSDIDIAVEFNDITEHDAVLFRRNILGGLPEKADVQVYNVLPENVRKEIDEKGRLLYKNDPNK